MKCIAENFSGSVQKVMIDHFGIEPIRAAELICKELSKLSDSLPNSQLSNEELLWLYVLSKVDIKAAAPKEKVEPDMEYFDPDGIETLLESHGWIKSGHRSFCRVCPGGAMPSIDIKSKGAAITIGDTVINIPPSVLMGRGDDLLKYIEDSITAYTDVHGLLV